MRRIGSFWARMSRREAGVEAGGVAALALLVDGG